MKRRAARTEAAKFSLFPFLAVLLCVMGALIVLLIVIAQRTHDRAAARSAAGDVDEKLKIEREELAWRIDMIHVSRDQTAAQLAEQRAGLSHIEDHARRLRDQYRALEQAAKDLQRTLASPSAESQSLDDELAAIQARIREVNRELEAKRLAPQPVAGYAIIPYEGPNGTQRRPMYIECTDAGIILQPEGVVLTAEDFLGPLGPGNPLAASMRAAREYLQRNRDNDAREAGEPYPLLLIRPDRRSPIPDATAHPQDRRLGTTPTTSQTTDPPPSNGAPAPRSCSTPRKTSSPPERETKRLANCATASV